MAVTAKMVKELRDMTNKYVDNMLTKVEELLSLPGIGSYTAGAIASIAWGREEPAVDGNVLRVMSRVCGSMAVIDEARVKKAWEEVLRSALQLFGKDLKEGVIAFSGPAMAFSSQDEKFNYPGAFNQALMDLGAGVCLPGSAPLCSGCPLGDFCTARRENLVAELPVRAKKKDRRISY